MSIRETYEVRLAVSFTTPCANVGWLLANYPNMAEASWAAMTVLCQEARKENGAREAQIIHTTHVKGA